MSYNYRGMQQMFPDMSCPGCHKAGQVHTQDVDRYRPRLRGLKIPLPYTNKLPKYVCHNCGQCFDDDKRI